MRVARLRKCDPPGVGLTLALTLTPTLTVALALTLTPTPTLTLTLTLTLALTLTLTLSHVIRQGKGQHCRQTLGYDELEKQAFQLDTGLATLSLSLTLTVALKMLWW